MVVFLTTVRAPKVFKLTLIIIEIPVLCILFWSYPKCFDTSELVFIKNIFKRENYWSFCFTHKKLHNLLCLQPKIYTYKKWLTS